jgi:type IV pilus assembly protein PilC
VISAEYFERELGNRIRNFTALFEPIMIVGVGAIVGFVALALVSAMYGVLGGVSDEEEPVIGAPVVVEAVIAHEEPTF